MGSPARKGTTTAWGVADSGAAASAAAFAHYEAAAAAATVTAATTTTAIATAAAATATTAAAAYPPTSASVEYGGQNGYTNRPTGRPTDAGGGGVHYPAEPSTTAGAAMAAGVADSIASMDGTLRVGQVVCSFA
jgi:hypothetical protein